MPDLQALRYRYGANKTAVFLITFSSYVCFHCSRKTFSVIKGALTDAAWFESSVFEKDEQTEMQALIDTLFLFTYAAGLYVSGVLGDRFDLRIVLTLGMVGSAATVGLFGLGGFLKIHALSFYAVVWSMNGLIQSTGWPSNVAIMGNWFDFSNRGAVFGVWAGNASLGNIVGTAVVAMTFHFIAPSTGWMVALVLAAVLVALDAVLVFLLLVPHPKERATAITSESSDFRLKVHLVDEPQDEFADHEYYVDREPPSISFWSAWLIPGVIPYSLSYACLKAVNYALFFWLPFYLKNEFHMEDQEADAFSMLYDLGQIVGGFFGGYVSDRLGVRSPVIFVMMLASSAAMVFLDGAKEGDLALLLFFIGCLMGGPANLISSTISADLGTHPLLRGNAKALSTVTGIVDGTGSIGAALAQYLVGYLAHCRFDGSKTVCSWKPVFLMFEIGDVAAALCLITILVRELPKLCQSRRRAAGNQTWKPVSTSDKEVEST